MKGNCQDCIARIGCPEAKQLGYESCPIPERIEAIAKADAK